MLIAWLVRSPCSLLSSSQCCSGRDLIFLLCICVCAICLPEYVLLSVYVFACMCVCAGVVGCMCLCLCLGFGGWSNRTTTKRAHGHRPKRLQNGALRFIRTPATHIHPLPHIHPYMHVVVCIHTYATELRGGGNDDDEGQDMCTPLHNRTSSRVYPRTHARARTHTYTHTHTHTHTYTYTTTIPCCRCFKLLPCRVWFWCVAFVNGAQGGCMGIAAEPKELSVEVLSRDDHRRMCDV